MAVPRKLKKADQKSKRILVKLMRFFLPDYQAKEQFHGPLRSVVILAQERLGDLILLTPLINILRQSNPDLVIDVVIFSNEGYFFEQDKNINQVIRAKKKYISYARKMLSFKYNVLYCTKDHPSFNFLLHTRFIRADIKIGITHDYHQGFFHHLLDIDLDTHVIEKNCTLLDYLGISYSKEDIRPYLPENEVSQEIEDFVNQIEGKSIVGINLSAGGRDREWPVEKWQELISQLDFTFIILAMPYRSPDKEKLEKLFPNIIPSPRTASIFEAGKLISQVQLLITPDTSLIHVASCYEVPVVAMYLRNIGLHRFYPYGIPYKRLVTITDKNEDIPLKDVLQAIKEIGEEIS